MNRMDPYKKAICYRHIYEYEKILCKKKMDQILFSRVRTIHSKEFSSYKMLNTQVGLQNGS